MKLERSSSGEKSMKRSIVLFFLKFTSKPNRQKQQAERKRKLKWKKKLSRRNSEQRERREGIEYLKENAIAKRKSESETLERVRGLVGGF